MNIDRGTTKISTAAAKRGENPPGTKTRKQLARRRRDMAKASRKQNRGKK